MQRYIIASKSDLTKNSISKQTKESKGKKQLIDSNDLTDVEFNKLRFDKKIKFKQYKDVDDAVDKE